MIRAIIILLLLLLNSPMLAQHRDLLFNNQHERYNFLDSVSNTIPQLDSLQRLNAIINLNKLAKKHKDKEILLLSKLLMIEHKKQSITNNNANSEYLKIITTAVNNDYDLLAAIAYSRFSAKLWELSNYSTGLHYDLVAYNLYKRYSLKEFPKRLKYQHNLAIKYYAFHDDNKAKNILLDLKTLDTTSIDNILPGEYYNTLALCYRNLEQYDSALYAFNIIYKNSLKTKKYTLATIASGNIGSIYFLTQRYDSAVNWLNQEIELVNKNSLGAVNENIARTYILLAKIRYLQGNFTLTENLLDKAITLFQNDATISTKKLLIDYYLLHARALKKQNKVNAAYQYLDSALIASDSINNLFNTARLFDAERWLDSTKHELILLKINHERQVNTYFRNTAIGIILLLILILLLLVNRYKMLQNRKKEALENEREKTLIELNNAKKQLEQFTKTIHEKNIIIEQISTEVSPKSGINKKHMNTETLAQLQKLTILTEDEWLEFKELFEQVHTNFIYQIKRKYKLTPAEIRFMTLRKLKFTNKEMANVLGVSESAIRNYKYRLRKKYGIDTIKDIEAFIEDN